MARKTLAPVAGKISGGGCEHPPAHGRHPLQEASARSVLSRVVLSRVNGTVPAFPGRASDASIVESPVSRRRSMTPRHSAAPLRETMRDSPRTQESCPSGPLLVNSRCHPCDNVLIFKRGTFRAVLFCDARRCVFITSATRTCRQRARRTNTRTKFRIPGRSNVNH